MKIIQVERSTPFEIQVMCKELMMASGSDTHFRLYAAAMYLMMSVQYHTKNDDDNALHTLDQAKFNIGRAIANLEFQLEKKKA